MRKVSANTPMTWYLKSMMFRVVVLTLLLIPASSVLAQQSFTLSAQEWAVPRDATRVTEIPALSQAVNTLLSQPESGLLIRYPGGDRGQWWANELKAWLLSLGIGPELLELRPGPVPEDTIEIQVVPKRTLLFADS